MLVFHLAPRTSGLFGAAGFGCGLALIFAVTKKSGHLLRTNTLDAAVANIANMANIARAMLVVGCFLDQIWQADEQQNCLQMYPPAPSKLEVST